MPEPEESRSPSNGGEAVNATASGDEQMETPPAPSPERRRLLGWLAISIGTLAGAALAIPWLALFLTPVRRDDPDAWRRLGPLNDFPLGETVKVTYLDPMPLPWAGFVAESAAWVRREGEDEFVAFATYCTHVGCPVRWEHGAELFMCPCHGGAFYADGSVAAGPPPRSLDRYPVRVRNGFVEIQAVSVRSPRRAS